MAYRAKKWRKIGIFTAGVVAVSLILWVGLMGLGVVPSPGSTISKTELRISNLHGYDYEVIYTNVDSLAKWEYVSVYASRTRPAHGWPYLRIFEKRSLLFRYDPAMWNSPLPVIASSGRNSISISIPRVSQVFFERKKWGSLTINYDIGQVDYPDGVSTSEKVH